MINVTATGVSFPNPGAFQKQKNRSPIAWETAFIILIKPLELIH
jgi:hypothetical protein